MTCDIQNEQIVTYLRMYILLFADDTVIFSENKEDLQKALDVFETYCDTWKLTVNITKTKIMIFSGGRMPGNMHFHFKGNEIEIVNEYKYLGIYLARTASYFKTKKHIADQANVALFSLLRKIRHLNLPIDLQIDLFNKTIKPILLYGCELWGAGNVDVIERVQLKFLKHILHLKKSTSSFMIYGELGVYPLIVDIQSRMVSYWTKLVVHGTNIIATTLYHTVFSLNEQGKLKTKWLDNIKHLVSSNGYANIWDRPTEFNPKWFTGSFKQKLKDVYVQNWNSTVTRSSSGQNYRIFKDTFEMNNYFTFLPNSKCRLLTAFRTRNHHLPIEVGRWSSIPINDRICTLCNNGVGDEFHYVLECESVNEQRKEYIKAYYRRNPNTLKFHSLMNVDNKTSMYKLCLFIDIILKTIKDKTVS